MNFTGEQGRVHIPSPYVNSRVTSQEKRSTIVLWKKQNKQTPKQKHHSVTAWQAQISPRCSAWLESSVVAHPLTVKAWFLQAQAVIWHDGFFFLFSQAHEKHPAWMAACGNEWSASVSWEFWWQWRKVSVSHLCWIFMNWFFLFCFVIFMGVGGLGFLGVKKRPFSYRQ